MDDKKLEGFRMGDFFISFPPGDFIEENEDGSASLIVDIFRINKHTNECVRINENEITQELQDNINYEVNKMLMEAIQQEELRNKNNVKD
jgi:hypothetical protein